MPDIDYKQRRKQLLKTVDVDLVVIGANLQQQSSMDQTHKFRQDSNFYYLTGVLESDWVLVIDVQSNEEWLIEPAKSNYKTIFDGDSNEVAARASSGIKQIIKHKQGWKKLKTLLGKAGRVGVQIPPEKMIKRYQMLANPSRRFLLEHVERHFDGELVGVADEIAKMRVIKDEAEIQLIDEAAAFTIDVLDKVNDSQFKSEYEVEAFITQQFRIGNYEHAYFPIVAGGPNATTLHYSQNSAPLNPGLLLIDVGASKQMYGADITRTIPIGNAPKSQLMALDALTDIQKRLISIIKPGLTLKQLESEAMHLIGAALSELGLIDKPDDKLIRQYFPHSVSHFLGLDVHDVGDYSQKLAPGMVITIEPGIYDRSNGFGIRIEDDILVTREGCRILGYNKNK